MVSALAGVAVNGYVAFSMRGQGMNLNIRAALLHALGDLAPAMITPTDAAISIETMGSMNVQPVSRITASGQVDSRDAVRERAA